VRSNASQGRAGAIFGIDWRRRIIDAAVARVTGDVRGDLDHAIHVLFRMRNFHVRRNCLIVTHRTLRRVWMRRGRGKTVAGPTCRLVCPNLCPLWFGIGTAGKGCAMAVVVHALQAGRVPVRVCPVTSGQCTPCDFGREGAVDVSG